jgi:formate dehydrogenase major subunit
VRACEEVQGTFALTIEGRGFDSRVSAGMAATISCPRIASVLRGLRAGLPDRDADREQGDRDRHARTYRQDHLRLLRGRLFSSRPICAAKRSCAWCPTSDGKANRGHSCVKGRFAWGYATHQDRQTQPMIRDNINDPWRVVGWDEALDFAANRLRHSGAKRSRARCDRGHHLVALHQ